MADLLVVGLGNPGQEYARSCHNVGAEVVAELAARHGGRLKLAKKERALVAEVTIGRPAHHPRLSPDVHERLGRIGRSCSSGATTSTTSAISWSCTTSSTSRSAA